ncbi:MAG TPA: right-handed parallel beta-helix repeat-containing protein [Fimbriimonadaceae bacterium]|nr:right-handed parallel beta-helix repeat-containing protein [Fimbriimonadaceae bacterium]HRJ95857.1 right-handed parallel beta-helix repeat-containing protein [Fimbriimonadaceae bacterium]
MRPLLVWVAFLSVATASAATLTVGTGRMYARIEDANAAASPGDTIAVYRTAGDLYVRPMILVTKANLRFVGMEAAPVVLDGTGGNYSGAGSVPRAIFQANPGASGLVIENLELRNARNTSFNGAGVRINQASSVTVRRCLIHSNDMGIMSNGDGATPTSASNQLIEYCQIYSNGNASNPGFNHNLYLGGTSATVQFCAIHSSTTGHNFKSRAHFNLLRYNHVYDSANRELDLVDDWDTTRPHSHTVLLGNVIVKKLDMSGNRTVIHFGQDGGAAHNGTLFLIHNTIVTTYVSPIVQVSSTQARVDFVNNVIYNGVQSAPTLVSGHSLGTVSGNHNWISRGYSLAGTSISPATRYQGGTVAAHPGFANASLGDYFLLQTAAGYPAAPTAKYFDGDGTSRSGTPQFQYHAVASGLGIEWRKPCLGAGVKR